MLLLSVILMISACSNNIEVSVPQIDESVEIEVELKELGQSDSEINSLKVVLNNKELISKILKTENIVTSYEGDFVNIDISFDDTIVSIYYDGSMSEEEKEKLIKEKERLISSIERREKLLSHQIY